MRPLAILLATLAMALAPEAAAAKNDKTPPGQVLNADKPEPPGQAKPDKPEPPGQVKNQDKPEPPGQAGQDEPPAANPAIDELEEAHRAVEAHEALPLAKIIKIAQSQTDGRVIDARLVRINGALLYQLTFLDDGGRSWRGYFYARTGNPVSIR